jgi:hypothetical protein
MLMRSSPVSKVVQEKITCSSGREFFMSISSEKSYVCDCFHLLFLFIRIKISLASFHRK